MRGMYYYVNTAVVIGSKFCVLCTAAPAKGASVTPPRTETACVFLVVLCCCKYTWGHFLVMQKTVHLGAEDAVLVI